MMKAHLTIYLCMSIAVLLAALSGCASTSGPYMPAEAAARSPLLAERLTQEAVAAIDRGDEARGEELLREALTADLYHGPAHNNLGVLYLSQGKLYEAASEFEWAKKLLPGHPDPRLNLAMTLDRAGQIDEALTEYRSALEVWPGHMPSIQAYAKCQIKHAVPQEDLPELLDRIALAGETEEWQLWGRLQAAKRGK